MIKYFKFFILLFLIIVPELITAQNKKPKVALVLSGGGAKGIAHIPTLQILDSLGIVPDLIVGTSMGGLVGGFYAIGYSGDSIEKITREANWDELLGGVTNWDDVGVEEKSEYKRYMIDFDLEKGKPKKKSSLLNDQNLREFFATYSYPVYRINDFDKLSIPYRALATDIVNGKEVVIGSGSISTAMRATMSIPSVFAPVPYKDVLLIDGGVLNNFPVDVAKRMGADIIIGSDVGGGLEPKEKLNNITSILVQTSMLISLKKDSKNREICDILVDHVPILTYTTADFGKSNEIYEEGKIAAYNNMDAFVALAEKLKKYKQRPHKLPVVSHEVEIDSFIYKGISDANIDLVRSRANLIPHKTYTTTELKEGISRTMGTEIFNQITFNPVFKGDKIMLEIVGHEKSKHQVKGSIHYDSYRGIGLFLNYTGRNIFNDASRILLSVDVAEQPGFRIQYQNNFGKEKNWWWRSEILWQNLNQTFFFNGEKAEDVKNKFFQMDMQINKNINPLKDYVGFGLNYESTKLKPTINPEISDNIFDLEKYHFSNLELNAHYLYNNLNKVFYATNGRFIRVELARSLYHTVDVNFVDESITDVSGKTSGFTKLNFLIEQRLDFKKRFTAILGASAGFIFLDEEQSDQNSFLSYGIGGKYFLGGNLVRPRKDNYVFKGLHETELFVTQFMMVNLGLQVNPFGSVFLTPHFNIASVGYRGFEDYIKTAFSPKGNWQELYESSLLMSGGITASYDSFLGPVDIDISWVNDINKVRIFFTVGIPLNRSN
jgi:NTE family protein